MGGGGHGADSVSHGGRDCASDSFVLNQMYINSKICTS